MPDSSPADIQFLNQLQNVIDLNLAREEFGVTELADAMSMSRSNLLRKVKKLTNLSVNQLIREARLKRAMELLQHSTSNVSEVSHQVGFNSTSYFIKCFREHYGYPPGETSKRGLTDPLPNQIGSIDNKKKFLLIGLSAAGMVLLVFSIFYYFKRSSSQTLERSIVVLPFKNESNDSSNVYLINGLMESTLNNLQKIDDLRVLSRTSSEKYRNTQKSIPEMALELQASYFVEGSGQKIGDQILLTIQLIEGPTDKHIWSKQYRREANDIFALQQEVAKNIAEEIEVVMSPQARQRIEKIPTENLEAYDLYLKGKDFFYQKNGIGLSQAMLFFKKAIELDDRFALAYAHLVMTEYYLDIFMIQKNYTEEISTYADKALLFDPRSGESLTAKALAYAYAKDYASATLYLEKALEYNPHSGLVLYHLTELYGLFVPDPAKYVEYSLRAAREDQITMDSATLGFKYFHVSNALVQAGFLDEGVHYIDLSMKYDPNAFFARYVSILLRFAKNQNIELTKELLRKEFNKDTMRVDIVKELARLSYMSRDYEEAHHYYQIFIARRAELYLEIYKEEFLCISYVLAQQGMKKEAAVYRQRFKQFADSDESSIYKHLMLSLYYANVGDSKKSIEELKLFSKEENYFYWIVLVENDPQFDSIKNLPEFRKVMDVIKKKFWKRHEKIEKDMKEKGLYPFEEYLK